MAEVARSIVTSQELQPLLDSVTHLISERFNFYHVGIFLIDQNHEFAVLRAANSEGGQRMLARKHKLRVGKVGIVGYVTCAPASPESPPTWVRTRSSSITRICPEPAQKWPCRLKVGDQIIGAMDVQSTESNAFLPDDIELFATLADQVAIAIHNNQSVLETPRALTESQSLHRQYLRQEWESGLISARKNRSYQYTPEGIVARRYSKFRNPRTLSKRASRTRPTKNCRIDQLRTAWLCQLSCAVRPSA